LLRHRRWPFVSMSGFPASFAAVSCISRTRGPERQKRTAKAADATHRLEGESMPLSVNRRHVLAAWALRSPRHGCARFGRAAESWPIRQVKYVNGFPAVAPPTRSRGDLPEDERIVRAILRGREQAGAGGVLGAMRSQRRRRMATRSGLRHRLQRARDRQLRKTAYHPRRISPSSPACGNCRTF